MARQNAPRGLAPAAEASPDFHRLVEQNLGLVEPIAQATWRKLPRGLIELEDVIQAGFIGLIDAARRYQPGKGLFAVYAKMRIRGAIIDSIRCEPYAGWISNRQEFPATLAAPESEGDLPGRRQLRLEQALVSAIEGLTEQQQQILELVYFKGMSTAEIGDSKVLNIGKSQVVKLRKAALDKLREGLRKAA